MFKKLFVFASLSIIQHLEHGEIIYGGTRWIEDDCSATFSDYIFGCKSSPISRNVPSLVSQLDKCKIRLNKAM